MSPSDALDRVKTVVAQPRLMLCPHVLKVFAATATQVVAMIIQTREAIHSFAVARHARKRLSCQKRDLSGHLATVSGRKL